MSKLEIDLWSCVLDALYFLIERTLYPPAERLGDIRPHEGMNPPEHFARLAELLSRLEEEKSR